MVTVRAGNIIGGGDWNEDRLIPDLVKNIYLNKKFKLRSLKSTRPWQHVLDVIFIYTSIIKSVYANYKLSGAYNLGPKKSYSVKKILLYLKKKKLFNKVYIYNKNYFAEKNFLSISSKKIFKTFNIKNKINFYKSLELTFNWYKNFYLGINPDKLIDDDLNFYEINFKK